MIHDCILGLWLSPSGECHPGCGGSAPPPTGNASLSSVFTKPPLIGDNLCLVVFTGRRSRGSFHLSQVSHGKASIRHLSSASLSPFNLADASGAASWVVSGPASASPSPRSTPASLVSPSPLPSGIHSSMCNLFCPSYVCPATSFSPNPCPLVIEKQVNQGTQ